MKTERRTEQRVITNTYTVYIANDGKEFESEIKCEEYEKELKEYELREKIEKLRISKLDDLLPITNDEEWRDVDVYWYNVKSEEDYNMIYDYYNLCSCVDYFYEPKLYPAVMGVVDNGDYADVYYIETIIDQVKNFFNIFNMDVIIKERR